MILISLDSLAMACVVGLMSGCHASIWGMYKDALHEGFRYGAFLRSITIGAIVAVFLEIAFDFPLPAPRALVLLFGLAYAVERGIVEVWKTFIRQEDQSKYFIPMQFSIGGVPVTSASARLAAGGAYIATVVAILLVVRNLNDGASTLPHTGRAALGGFAVGMLLAIGGAWKDAPKDGFDIVKFFRSPAMTVFYACLLAQLTADHLLIAAAAIGYERATAETYKTFFFPSKPRGKFSGKPVLYPALLKKRQYFVPVYVSICASVIVCAVAAL
jgi:hypothetical protein